MVDAKQAREYTDVSKEKHEAERFAKYVDYMNSIITKRSQNGWDNTTITIDDDVEGAKKLLAMLEGLGYNTSHTYDDSKYKYLIRVSW